MNESPTQANRRKSKVANIVDTLNQSKGIKRKSDEIYSMDYDDDYEQPISSFVRSMYSDDECGANRSDSSDSEDSFISSESEAQSSSDEESDSNTAANERDNQSGHNNEVKNPTFGLYPAHILLFNKIDSSRKVLKSLPKDSEDKLMINSENSMTKKEFAKLYVQHEAFHGVNKVQTDALFALLAIALPDINWPTVIVKSKSNTTKIKAIVDLYAPRDVRSFELHVCINGCMAFINETAYYISCTVCHHPRFLKCNQHNCKNRLCNPYAGGHGLKYRISNKIAYYRTIIPLLKELFQWSFNLDAPVYCVDQSKKSHTAARYSAKTESAFDKDYVGSSDDVHTNRVEDIADSKQACHHLNEMHAAFEKIRMLDGNDNLIEASFVLGEFYDGGTLFKRKAKSIWPLVLSILNCNPSIRVKPGIGMFMVAVHDLSLGCMAEQSLYKDLFIPELNFLFEGTIFAFDDVHGNQVRVFLQARLVIHILDTIALLDVFKLKGLHIFIITGIY